MDNQYNKTGAGLRFAVAPNATYATLAANIAACLFGIANDRKAWVFADNEGNVYKTLQDASGDGNIPEHSILFADSAGRATSDTELLFNASTATMTFPLPFTLNFGGTAEGAQQFVVSDTGVAIQKRSGGAWVTTAEFF